MNKEKETSDFLAEIYRGARMGVESIDNIINKTSNEEIKKELKYQLDRYEEIEKESYNELAKHNAEAQEIPVMQRVMAKMSISVNTASDHSASNIAELLIRGNTMGVTGITKSLHKHVGADSSAAELAKRFISLEQENIERLKRFL